MRNIKFTIKLLNQIYWGPKVFTMKPVFNRHARDGESALVAGELFTYKSTSNKTACLDESFSPDEPLS